MNTREAFAKEVLDSNGNRIGKVNDLIFDLPSGNISQLVLRTGLLKERKVAVGLIDKVGDKIILNVTRDRLEGRS